MKKSPPTSRNWTHDLKSFALQACALPLGYNRCPFFFMTNMITLNYKKNILELLIFIATKCGYAIEMFYSDHSWADMGTLISHMLSFVYKMDSRFTCPMSPEESSKSERRCRMQLRYTENAFRAWYSLSWRPPSMSLMIWWSEMNEWSEPL